MAKPGRIKELEMELGEPADVFIPRTVNKNNSIAKACRELKLSRTAIYNWAQDNGFTTRRRYVVEMVKESA